MAFKSWARRSTSVGVGVLLACGALPQAFGRFGYAKRMDLPGMVVDGAGFRVRQAAADVFRFATPSPVWSCQSISAQGEIVVLSGIGRSPLKLKSDLWSPGFSMYLHHGMALKLSSTVSPYLSWQEGSVGPGVPTPLCKWVLLSFRDNQPPVLFAFPGKPEALVIKGKAGDWTVETASAYVGWVRVVAPLGTEPHAANSAQALGALVQRILPQVERWSAPPVQLKGLAVADTATSVTATWSFDKPGAMLPSAAFLAPLGGYAARVDSRTEKTAAIDECGPQSVCLDTKLVIRFPLRRLPTGRSVAVGALQSQQPGTVSSLDLGGIVELALWNLLGARDRLLKAQAEEALAAFLSDADYVPEPFTGQKLPFGVDGHGADLVAAHALLMQSLSSTVSATSEANSLLTSLTWRRDAYQWVFWGDDPVSARRTGALAALAGAICAEPERRLDAALFEAGVAAQRGLAVWRRRRGDLARETPLIEPLETVRSALFSAPPKGRDDSFVGSLMSEVRLYGDFAVSLLPGEVHAYRMQWTSGDTRPMSLTLASAYPIAIEPTKGLDRFVVSDALGFTVVRCTPKDAGTCEAALRIPSWASSLPAAQAPPRYSETAR